MWYTDEKIKINLYSQRRKWRLQSILKSKTWSYNILLKYFNPSMEERIENPFPKANYNLLEFICIFILKQNINVYKIRKR